MCEAADGDVSYEPELLLILNANDLTVIVVLHATSLPERPVGAAPFLNRVHLATPSPQCPFNQYSYSISLNNQPPSLNTQAPPLPLKQLKMPVQRTRIRKQSEVETEAQGGPLSLRGEGGSTAPSAPRKLLRVKSVRCNITEYVNNVTVQCFLEDRMQTVPFHS